MPSEVDEGREWGKKLELCRGEYPSVEDSFHRRPLASLPGVLTGLSSKELTGGECWGEMSS